MLARKSALNEAGGFSEDPVLFAVEDMDLWLRIALQREIVCASEEPLFLYRVHGQNLSRGGFSTLRRTLYLARKFLPEAGFPAYARKAALSAVSILFRSVSPGD